MLIGLLIIFYEIFSSLIYLIEHGKESFKMGLKGIRNGIEYILASCDYTDFNLIKIMD